MSTVNYYLSPLPANIVSSAIPPEALKVLGHALNRQQIPNWKFHLSEMCKTLVMSRYAVKKARKWLLEHGYATYERIKFRFTVWRFFPFPCTKETASNPRIIERVEIQTVLQVEIQPVLELKESLEIKEKPQPAAQEQVQKDIVVVSSELIYPSQLTEPQKKAAKHIIKKVKQPELQQPVLFALAYAITSGTVKSAPAYLQGLVTRANNGTFEPVGATTAINQGGQPLVPIWKGFGQSTPSKPEVASGFIQKMKAAARGSAT